MVPSCGGWRVWSEHVEYGANLQRMRELDEGLQWLNKAKKLEDVRQQALEMEDKWERLGA